jgi:RimJ/RimL family protein N-acetyltransferase
MLQTERIILREWRDEDLIPFAALNADPRVMEFFPKTLSRVESDTMAELIREGIATRGFGLWALEIVDVSDFAGFTGLSVPRYETPFTPCVEIAWRLAFDHWGHGYASEAARAVLNYGHQQLGLREIVSFTAEINLRSRRVMERVGMRFCPEESFDHPLISPGDRLSKHVLYRSSGPA